MAQSRNSSGRGDDRSDLDDTKALAAKARSETGGPVLRPNAAELSGVRPRRDSVVGIRVTPSARAASGELPNWFWGVLGCLSVLLVGFAALFVLGRSGKLGALVGDAVSAVAPVPAAAPPAAVAPPAVAPTEPVAAGEPRRPRGPSTSTRAPSTPRARRGARRRARGACRRRARGRLRPADNAAPAAARPAAAAPAAPAPGRQRRRRRPRRPREARRARRAAKARVAKAGEAPAAATTTAPAATPPRPRRRQHGARRRAAAKAAGDDTGDDEALPGQDDVERALDALATKVRGCFVKYQIKGTARVRLVATPAGKADSVNVTGDFEDTPTGLCVESVLSEAKLPSFKGPPLKLSQSYQLR